MKVMIKGTGWQFPSEYYPAEKAEAGKADNSIVSMVYGAVRRCMDDAGEGMPAVDAVVTASVDLLDGKTASNISITEVVGAVMKPETRIAGDGLFALAHAAMTILSGQYRRVLVVAHSKASEGDQEKLSNWTYDPVFQQPLDLTDSVALGLQAQAFLRSDPAGLAEAKARAELVAALSAGDCQSENILSSCGDLNVDKVLASRISFSPLHELEIAGPGDGAAAVLLESGENEGVELQGFGYSFDRHYLGDRDLSRSRALIEAAARAGAMAKMNNMKAEVKRCYWSLRSSIQLPLWAESAGIWNFEDGLEELLAKGGIKTGSGSPNHPGFNQWHRLPLIAIGLQRLISAVKDIENQDIDGSALVQGCHGPAGQTQVACLLR
ncbi:MAG: hypothetical protein GY866_40490 [Proteobacteria bacterium]|nr:hypothetical protein [Pseudomonadota bacterium]